MTRFQIRVDDRHVIENTATEGLILRTTDGGPVGYGPRQQPYPDWPIRQFLRITTSLLYLGFDVGRSNDFQEARNMLRERLGQAEKRASADPQKGFIAVFGNGRQKARWNPGSDEMAGDWTLVRQAILPEEIIFGHNMTEHLPHLEAAVWGLIEHTLTSAATSISYEVLDAAFAGLTDAMTAGLQVIEGEDN